MGGPGGDSGGGAVLEVNCHFAELPYFKAIAFQRARSAFVSPSSLLRVRAQLSRSEAHVQAQALTLTLTLTC